MKSTRFFVAALGLLVGLTASNLLAQGVPTRSTAQPATQPARQSARPQIAFIDISRVFKEHPRFSPSMAQLKAKMDKAEADMKARGERLQQQVEQLKNTGLKSGSPEYKAQEKSLQSQRAQMQIDLQMQRKEFLQEEAAIYHQIYEDVQNAVASYAMQVGLHAVIRYASQPEEADPQQPDLVLREIQKDLVWFNDGLDITGPILSQLQRGSMQPQQRTGIPYPARQPSQGSYQR